MNKKESKLLIKHVLVSFRKQQQKTTLDYTHTLIITFIINETATKTTSTTTSTATRKHGHNQIDTFIHPSLCVCSA